jgi:hypothetical protein
MQVDSVTTTECRDVEIVSKSLVVSLTSHFTELPSDRGSHCGNSM